MGCDDRHGTRAYCRFLHKADAQGKELDELFFEMTGGEKA